MSLDFDSSSSDQYVNFGNASGIQDWTEFTFCGWFYPDDSPTLPRLFSKSEEKELRQQNVLGTNMLDGLVDRSPTKANSWSVENVVEIDVWQFFAMTYDESDGVRLFKGTLNTVVAEVSYDTRNVGSGATKVDNSVAFVVGQDLGVGGSGRGFRGRVANIAYINKRLTPKALAPLQFRPNNMVVPGGETKLYSELGFNGIGTQPDLSGNGNNGTVTGAIVAAHAPITIVPPRPLIITSERRISPFPCFLPAS